MKKIIDTKDLKPIAEDILHNVFMLELSNEETAESDIGFYVPHIKRAAEDLKRLYQTAPAAPEDLNAAPASPPQGGVS